jgi:hypothetical protein
MGNNFSRQSPEFKKQRFRWLDQVLVDPELPASAFKVAYRIGDDFNDVQQDGRAWEGCKEIARAIGMSEKTVITMVRRLNARGHLRVEWGKQGRGHPNNYWMILKPASTQVSDQIKPASTPNKTCAHAGEPRESNHEGTPIGVPSWRESGYCRPACGGGPFGAPSSAARKERRRRRASSCSGRIQHPAKNVGSRPRCRCHVPAAAGRCCGLGCCSSRRCGTGGDPCRCEGVDWSSRCSTLPAKTLGLADDQQLGQAATKEGIKEA